MANKKNKKLCFQMQTWELCLLESSKLFSWRKWPLSSKTELDNSIRPECSSSPGLCSPMKWVSWCLCLLVEPELCIWLLLRLQTNNQMQSQIARRSGAEFLPYLCCFFTWSKPTLNSHPFLNPTASSFQHPTSTPCMIPSGPGSSGSTQHSLQ